jgi:putative ABC transport system permease protein
LLTPRLALRSLSRNPVLSVAAVCALGVAIGANTALFSVVRSVLLRPLPYDEPDRVVRVHNRWEGTPRARLSPAEYFDYLDQAAGAFARLGGYAYGAANVTGDGPPERVRAAAVTPEALPAFGVKPIAGRLPTAEDESAGRAVAVISYGYWQRRLGGSDAVGRTLVVDGEPTTIIGILPRGFRLPESFGAGGDTDLYVPLGLERARVSARGSHFLLGVGRLRPGTTLEQAQATLSAVAERFVREYPDDYPADMRFGVGLVPIRDEVVGEVRPVLEMLLGAVALVLLIACGNVAGLLLTRGEARRRDLALRQALGASRGRIVAELLVEGLTLAALGGLLGAGLATWGVGALRWLQPDDLPLLAAVTVDGSVLGYAAALSLLTGLVAGLAPALLAGASPAEDLREGGRSLTPGRRARALRRSFVAAQVAVAVVLVTGTGLLLRTLESLLHVDPGYETRHVLTTRLSLPDHTYPTDAARRRFFATLVARAAELPGVEAAGAVTNLPLDSRLGDLNIEIEGRETHTGEVSPALDWQVVTPGYFEALAIPLVRGRAIEPGDGVDSPGVVVINQAAARLYFPNEDPLGRRFRLGGGAGPGWVSVVGIVGDVRHEALGAPPRPEMYLAHEQFHFWNGGPAPSAMSVVLRVQGDPSTYVEALRREIARFDPTLPPGPFRTFEAVARESVARPRFVLRLLSSFAGLALLLATLGTYGVVAQLVAERRGEMGLRMALGARRAQVFALVLRHGMTTVGTGVALGVVGALLLGRSLAGLLYGVRPRDPLTLLATAAVLAAAGALASALPARRATRVDPAEALRNE